MYDPQGVAEFDLFDVVDPTTGVSLYEIKKMPKGKNPFDQLKSTASPIRVARVAQLEKLYAERMTSEVSPFDDKSGDVHKFVAEYSNG